MRLNKSDLLYLVRNPCDYFVNSQTFVDAWFFNKILNVGDLVGPYLLEKLSGKKVRKNIFGIQPHYISVGSIFDQVTENSIVWGAGFMKETDKLHCRPSQVRLVRGKLTKNKLPSGITCALGDPALALAHYYSPHSNLSKSQLIGVVLHYSDEHLMTQIASQEGVKLINVKQGVESFVDEISDCRYIFSSSLHGLVIADAYQVPNCWIKFDTCQRTDSFKYRDYYSIYHEGDVPEKPLIIQSARPISLISQVLHCRTRNIEKHVRMIINSFG